MLVAYIFAVALISTVPGGIQTPSPQAGTANVQPSELQAACNNGNFDNCNRLALMYYSGRGVQKDETRAAQLFEKSCNGGFVPSCDNLGRAYASGRGVPKDEVAAVRLYRRTCEAGGSWGCADLGFMELSGRGTAKDEAGAFALFQRTCDADVTVGCDYLGSMYANGTFVQKDDARAVAIYQQGCNGRLPGACTSLGVMYAAGRGIAQDESRAVSLYQNACTQSNFASACWRLGLMYEAGRGVSKDAVQASKLYAQACNEGISGSCTSLGLAYATGIGVPADEARSLEFLQRACQGGDSNGCARLGASVASNRGGAAGSAVATTTSTSGTAPAASGRRGATPPTTTTRLATVYGTAFVVTSSGLFLTANHVVADARDISLSCSDGGRYTATVNATSPTSDLAVLQAATKKPFANVLPLAFGTNASLGDRVFTVGYPATTVLGPAPKYSEGTVSSLSGEAGDASRMQISVPVQPGNSGGALLDERGRVIGVLVTTANPAVFAAASGALPQNINWATKVALAAPLLPQLKDSGDKGSTDRQKAIARATTASCLVTVHRLVTVPATPPAGLVGGVAGGVVGGIPAPPPPPPGSTRTVRAGGEIKQPEKIKDVRPVYPQIAQTARVQGAVIIEATIGKDGHVVDAKVLRSVPLLDEAALDAVRQWEFTPTLVNGAPVQVLMTVTVSFALGRGRG